MKEMDELEGMMKEQNFTNLRPIPWKRITRISNTTKSMLFSSLSQIKFQFSRRSSFHMLQDKPFVVKVPTSIKILTQ